MKKFIVPFLVATLFLFGCVTTNYDQKLNDISLRIDKLEKKSILGAVEQTAASFVPARGIDGGEAGDLDKIDGSTLSAKDIAFVVLTEDASYGNAIFVYSYTDFGGEVTESLPYRVKPDTNPSANFAWELAFSSVAVPVVATGNITLTIGQARAGMVQQTAAGTVTIPKASTVGYGTMLCVHVKDASETCVINPDDADIIVLMGTHLAAGDSISSPGNAGDFMCMVSTADVQDGSNTDGWITMGYGEAAWTDSN